MKEKETEFMGNLLVNSETIEELRERAQIIFKGDEEFLNALHDIFTTMEKAVDKLEELKNIK